MSDHLTVNKRDWYAGDNDDHPEQGARNQRIVFNSKLHWCDRMNNGQISVDWHKDQRINARQRTHVDEVLHRAAPHVAEWPIACKSRQNEVDGC